MYLTLFTLSDTESSIFVLLLATFFFMFKKMECPICFEEACDKIFVRLPCASMGHFLCMQCFIHLENRKCPLCRHSFDNKIPVIRDQTRNNLIAFLSLQTIPTSIRSSLTRSIENQLENGEVNELEEGEIASQDETVVTTQLTVSRSDSSM